VINVVRFKGLTDFFFLNQVGEQATLASYKICEVLMKHGKPFSDGAIVKECILIAAGEMESTKSMSAISLSRPVVTERVEELGQDLKSQLESLCATFQWFSIALDESTDVVDTSQLCVYIRGVTDDLEIFQELLDVVPLHGTTTGEDVFEQVEKLFTEFKLEWAKLASVSTDGAPAMLGKKDGFQGRLKKKLAELGLPMVPLIHCIIHRENLCAKSLTISIKHLMSVVIKVVNFIRARGLNHRQFRVLLEDFDYDVDDIPYYCEVRFFKSWKNFGQIY